MQQGDDELSAVIESATIIPITRGAKSTEAPPFRLPIIIINGHPLDAVQSSILGIALCSFGDKLVRSLSDDNQADNQYALEQIRQVSAIISIISPQHAIKQ